MKPQLRGYLSMGSQHREPLRMGLQPGLTILPSMSPWVCTLVCKKGFSESSIVMFEILI